MGSAYSEHSSFVEEKQDLNAITWLESVMRVRGIHKASDYLASDAVTPREAADLFELLFPGVDDPSIDAAHAGIAVAARIPELALRLAKLSGFIAGELSWCKRRDLRELAIQSLNHRLGCEYSLRTRHPIAVSVGISDEMQAALPTWQTSTLFNDEQRLVIEYSNAVAAAKVPGELFDRVVAYYGEQGAIEFTALVAFWSFWAMFLNATCPS